MSLLIALAVAAAAPTGGSCQAALGPLYDGTEEEALPNRVDGTTLAGPDALQALRRQRGEATITIVGGSFARADFRAARLGNICFLDTDLSGSDWRGADAAGIGFVRTNLEGADLTGARMPGIALRQPNLKNARAAGADWSGGRLDGGWDGSFENVVLDRANLADFDFDCGITISDGCPIDRQISLRGADLSRASIHSWWFDADFTGARIDRTVVALHQLDDLRNASVAGPLLLRGGEATVELTAADLAAAVAAIQPVVIPDDAPSFACAGARSRAERMICAEDAYALREADRELAGIYRRAVAADPALATSQRAWLAERDRCADAACVERAYASRVSSLLGRMGPPAWARPGVRALFVPDSVGFSEAFRTGALYRRMLPAVVGGASSRAALRVNDDGSIDVTGDAVGGNAHVCSLGGERLSFDPASGWYSGPYEARSDDPAEWARRPMPVIRFDGEEALVYRGGQGGYGLGEDPRPSDYASCGARASFSTMVRVPVPDAEVDAMLAESAAEAE